MFHSVLTLCSCCGKFGRLDEKGKCPACQERCASYEALVTTGYDFQKKIGSLLEKHAFHMGALVFRAECEMNRTWSDDLRPDIEEQIHAWGDSALGRIKGLPKLDVVSLEFCHEQGESAAVYYGDYAGPFYHCYYKRRACSFHAVTHDLLQKPVFPEVYKKELSFFEFHHLIPALYLWQAWNRLWYTALAEGFYVLPDISDLPQG